MTTDQEKDPTGVEAQCVIVLTQVGSHVNVQAYGPPGGANNPLTKTVALLLDLVEAELKAAGKAVWNAKS